VLIYAFAVGLGVGQGGPSFVKARSKATIINVQDKQQDWKPVVAKTGPAAAGRRSDAESVPEVPVVELPVDQPAGEPGNDDAPEGGRGFSNLKVKRSRRACVSGGLRAAPESRGTATFSLYWSNEARVAPARVGLSFKAAGFARLDQGGDRCDQEMEVRRRRERWPARPRPGRWCA